jgi:hypothetical protein
MTANNDLKVTKSEISKDTPILITGRIGSGKNFDLLSRAVAAQSFFANRPGRDLSYIDLSSAASTSISD